MPRPSRHSPRVMLLAAALLVGCEGSGLSQAWQLDRLRVLGVRATPAEARPGETVSFEALYYLPDGMELELALWFACLPDNASDFGCAVDQEALDAFAGADLDSMTEEELAALYQQLVEAGLIGVEPLFPPTWTTPADALDGLDEQARIEGISAVINISAVPVGAQDDADTEIAYKRLPISEALTPNHNPDIAGFLVDGVPLASGATVAVDWSQVVQIEPVLASDALETYLYRADDGTDEERTEEPYLTWYVEAGSFDQPYSLYPDLGVAWTAPLSADELDTDDESWRLIAVMRDRRGGMGWAELRLDRGAQASTEDAATTRLPPPR